MFTEVGQVMVSIDMLNLSIVSLNCLSAYEGHRQLQSVALDSPRFFIASHRLSKESGAMAYSIPLARCEFITKRDGLIFFLIEGITEITCI